MSDSVVIPVVEEAKIELRGHRHHSHGDTPQVGGNGVVGGGGCASFECVQQEGTETSFVVLVHEHLLVAVLALGDEEVVQKFNLRKVSQI